MDTQLRANESDNPDAGTSAEAIYPVPSVKARAVPKLIQWLPILFAILLAGNFYYQWKYAEDFTYQQFDWKAHWIASPYRHDSVACFRKTFYLPDHVNHATMFLVAKDMYSLTVNGKALPGQVVSTLPTLQTNYSELAYYRRDYVATTFNLTQGLHRGKNVIALFVLAEQGTPKIAAQVEVDTSTHQQILSDNSWLVAPHEEKQGAVPWNFPNYLPTNWPTALQESGKVQAPLDIDPDAVQTPVAGILLSAPDTTKAQTVAFRKSIDCSARSDSSYLRVATTSPYDVYIDGKFVTSTSLSTQYGQTILVHDTTGQSAGYFDSPEAIQLKRNYSEFTRVIRQPQVDVLMLRNMFKSGKNTITVVLHPSILDPLPQVSVDGFVRTVDGRSVRIGAANNWQSSSNNGASWQPPVISAFPQEKYAGISSESVAGMISPGYTTYIHMARNAIIGLLICLIVVFAAEFWIRRNPLAAMRWPLPTPLAMLSLIALPTAVWMFISFVAQSTYRGSPQWSMFVLPEYGYWTLVSAGVVALIALVSILLHYGGAAARARRRDTVPLTAVQAERPQSPQSVTAMQFALKYGYAIAMGIVLIVVGAYATYNLGGSDFLPDEYTTLMAARGILQHGIPMYPMTDVIYSRSAIYHYILAMSMILAHSTTNAFADRIISSFWHICTTFLVYLIGREMKNRNVGVAAALVVGLSPFMLYYAREARFYSQFVFFATLFFYNLYRSLRAPESPKLRMYACLSYLGAYASQEFAVTLLPAWALLVVLAGQTRLWLQWQTVRWIVLAFAFMGAEFYLYNKYCVTPLTNVDQETILLMSFHADNLDQIPSMIFSGEERSNLSLGVLYFVGLIAVVLRPLFQHKPADIPGEHELVERRFVHWRWWNYCYVFVTVGVTLTDMLTPHPANRYVCHMFPPLAVCAVCVAFTLGEWLFKKIKELSGVPGTARFAQGLFLATILGLCLLAQRPARVWHNIAYSRILNRGTTLAPNYVHEHMQPGDKTLFFSPDLGTIILNQADYFWRPPANSVFITLRPNGKLVERDTGAELIDNVDKLRAAMASCNRLWIVVPRATINPGRSANDQMSEYVLANFRVQYEASGMEVYLWDKGWNHEVETVSVQPNEMYYF